MVWAYVWDLIALLHAGEVERGYEGTAVFRLAGCALVPRFALTACKVYVRPGRTRSIARQTVLDWVAGGTFDPTKFRSPLVHEQTASRVLLRLAGVIDVTCGQVSRFACSGAYGVHTM